MIHLTPLSVSFFQMKIKQSTIIEASNVDASTFRTVLARMESVKMYFFEAKIMKWLIRQCILSSWVRFTKETRQHQILRSANCARYCPPMTGRSVITAPEVE